MELEAFKATLIDSVAFFEGKRTTNPIREARRITKDMEKVAASCRALAATFESARPNAFKPMVDWKAIPPCF